MKKIDNMTDDGIQVFHLNSESGDPIDITLKFLPAIERWSIDVASTFINVSGLILANHPNILWPYKNLGDFGLACLSINDVDPFQFDDFFSNRSELFILSPEDLVSAEAFVAGYPTP